MPAMMTVPSAKKPAGTAALESVRELHRGLHSFPQHEADGCETQEGERLSVEALPILGEPAASTATPSWEVQRKASAVIEVPWPARIVCAQPIDGGGISCSSMKTRTHPIPWRWTLEPDS